MKRTLRILFLAVEINLLLWLAVFGMLQAPGAAGSALIKQLVVAGVAFAAIVQHWAYYAVYKRAKQAL
ncbi:MAG: hypothetical protein JSU63_03055 [Phycisphaerales bacterium]|nr:MAG: hypothetical protein JSU63_03055 [Phycisphaerales bacterium]